MKTTRRLIPGKEVTINLPLIKGKKIVGIKLKLDQDNEKRLELETVYEKDDNQEPGLLYKPNLN